VVDSISLLPEQRHGEVPQLRQFLGCDGLFVLVSHSAGTICAQHRVGHGHLLHRASWQPPNTSNLPVIPDTKIQINPFDFCSTTAGVDVGQFSHRKQSRKV